MRVSEYMSRPVVTVTPQTEFRRAFDLMRGYGVHHLPVVEDGRVVGLLGERDLLLAAANFGTTDVPVGEIMSSPAICISQGVEIKRAARVLVEKHIGSLPVLNAKSELVGIITETDIFKLAAGMLEARSVTRAAKTVRKAAGKTAAKATGKPTIKAAAKSAAGAARRGAAAKTAKPRKAQ